MIPSDKLPFMVGKPIHLSGAPKGCVWILVRIDGNLLHLRTPKTNKARTAKAADACYTRRYEPVSR